MAAIFLLIVFVALLLIGVGMVVAVIVAVATGLLTAAGIMSTSALLAWRQRNVFVGVQSVLLQGMTAVGAVAGGGLAMLIRVLRPMPLTWLAVLSAGVSVGAVAGVTIGMISNHLLDRLVRHYRPPGGFPVQTTGATID